MQKVTITLRADDAEPMLRKAAYEAALYGAWVDHITRRTHNAPADLEQRPAWQERFLAAKRIVEAFGVDYEQTSEAETLTVSYNYVGGKLKRHNIGGIAFNEHVGSQPDYKNPEPCYRREVHSQACHAAAQRVVKRWRENKTKTA